jgi:hypothetical protein
MARMTNVVGDAAAAEDDERVPIPSILVSQEDGDDTTTRTAMSKDEDIDESAPSISAREGIRHLHGQDGCSSSLLNVPFDTTWSRPPQIISLHFVGVEVACIGKDRSMGLFYEQESEREENAIAHCTRGMGLSGRAGGRGQVVRSTSTGRRWGRSWKGRRWRLGDMGVERKGSPRQLAQ